MSFCPQAEHDALEGSRRFLESQIKEKKELLASGEAEQTGEAAEAGSSSGYPEPFYEIPPPRELIEVSKEAWMAAVS